VSLTGKLLNYNGTPEMKWGQTNVLIATGLENTEVEALDWQDEEVEIYSVTGQNMSLQRKTLPQGVYILRNAHQINKIVVR
jgi:hypothetical protein